MGNKGSKAAFDADGGGKFESVPGRDTYTCCFIIKKY